jgi:hypothetical protein
MQNKKPIIIIAVLSVLAFLSGYWVGLPKEGSGGERGNGDPKEPDFLKQGLVAYYPFNGNAKDESGNGHDGDIVEATLCTNRFGVADSAFTFSAGNFIRVKDTFGETLTITSWALNVAPSQMAMLWCFGDQLTGPDLFWYQNHFMLNSFDVNDRPVNAFCSYQFPKAFVISRDGKSYGEVEFKFNPAHKGYVKMDKPFVGGLFSSSFNPSKGDLVLSQKGELLGMMANNTYCYVIRDLKSESSIVFRKDLSRAAIATTLKTHHATIQRKAFDLR